MSNTPLAGYRLASLIEVTRNGHCWNLTIDGERMPYLIDRIVDAPLDTDEIPSVTVTFLADSIMIDNSRPNAGKAPILRQD